MDEEFRHPRLAAVYDALDTDRSDLAPYDEFVDRLGARRVLDVGCGTGVFALSLAGRGIDVVGVDPAGASLDVARARPGADAVRWIHGDATTLAGNDVHDVDLATMTANVAMFLLDDAEFVTTFEAIAAVLADGGHVAFETRVPAARAWEGWTREVTRHTAGPPVCESVEAWVETRAVRLPFVDIRNSFRFGADTGETLASDSTLRYRGLDDLEALLGAAGLDIVEISDAADRPGREWIVLARPRGFTAFRTPGGAG